MRYARKSVGASAASMFLLDGKERFLTGLVSEWDWTRTSFHAELTQWPSVARALTDAAPLTSISAVDAKGGEADWFEAHGIGRAVCVPLRVGGSNRGVIFFDFEAAHERLGATDAAMLVDVARRCMRAFARVSPSARETPWLH
jgi:hypothetical protein